MRKKWNSEEMKEAARDARRALERERERMKDSRGCLFHNNLNSIESGIASLINSDSNEDS